MKVPKVPIATLALISTISAGAQVTTITLYGAVVPTQSPTTTISGPELGYSYSASPVSTQADGKTVYQEVLVVAKEVIAMGSSSTEITSGLPATLTRTMVQDASGFVETLNPTNEPLALVVSCSFEGTTQGVCVYDNVVGPSDHQTTIASTLTGAMSPIYTFIQASKASYPWKIGTAAIGSAKFSLFLSLITMGVVLL
ncbi:hypothetical protein NP233_g7375 [Leucocoprinus birnbaumii]|uniref:Uncharacterized protein n=1 Tax=Leucocoprinus birnbaumii TaxID=56174 RepID=A0AAD5YSU7_9AGAR|nr:hypothetical protein NP233_g7375 [Leucocoprinus birnbaumii]